jgi:[ribosomal protein S5]-alanine N-acetyltransferase
MDIALRRLTVDDATVIAPLINNRKVWDNLRDMIPHPYSEADGAFFISLTEKENPPLTFGIVCEGELCGVIGLVPQQDIYRFNAEIGYWLGEPYWGKGIATEAVRLMTDYGFRQLGFARIHTGVMAHNLASMSVLEKNDYQLEGIFRKAILKNGVFVDEYRYGRVEDMPLPQIQQDTI